MPFKNTFGSFSTNITESTDPIGGYYFGSELYNATGGQALIKDVVGDGSFTYIVGTYSGSGFIAKLDSNNKLLWIKYVNSATFSNVYVYGSYIYAVGTLLVQYDTDGNLNFQKSINASYSCIDTSGNLYLVSGTTISKMTIDGTFYWYTTISDGYHNFSFVNNSITYYTTNYWYSFIPTKIVVDSTGSTYIVGSCNGHAGTGSTTTQPSGTSPWFPAAAAVLYYNSCLIKLNANGTLAWQKSFEIGRLISTDLQTANGYISDIIIDSSDNLYISGPTYYLNTGAQSNGNAYSGFIHKIEKAYGGYIWHCDIGPGGTNSPTPTKGSTDWTSIVSDGAGNLYVSGKTLYVSFGSNIASVQLLFKLTDPGSTLPTVSNIAWVRPNTNSINNKLVRNRIFLHSNNGIFSTWSLNNTLPNAKTTWTISPTTDTISYGSLYSNPVVYNMTGGANPGSYWNTVETWFNVTNYVKTTTANTSTNTTNNPSNILTQAIVYFK